MNMIVPETCGQLLIFLFEKEKGLTKGIERNGKRWIVAQKHLYQDRENERDRDSEKEVKSDRRVKRASAQISKRLQCKKVCLFLRQNSCKSENYGPVFGYSTVYKTPHRPYHNGKEGRTARTRRAAVVTATVTPSR